MPQEIIDFPPAYANSDLHIGHIYQHCLVYPYYRFSDYSTQAKIFEKSKVFFQVIKPEKKQLTLLLGVDLNGHPITRSVIKNLNTTVSDIDTQKLKQECDLIANKNTLVLKNWYKKTGLYDLRNVKEYSTNDQKFFQLGQKYLQKLIETKLVKTENLPFRYCKNCQSFFSSSETELVDQVGSEYLFKVKLEETNEEYSIMTTRPELCLTGITAIVFHPEDCRYQNLKGKFLILKGPNGVLKVPVYASNYVYPKVGTGLVAVCKWGSLIDIEISRELGLTNESTLYDKNACVPLAIQEKYLITQYSDFFKKDWFKEIFKYQKDTLTKTLRHTQRSDCNTQIRFLVSCEQSIRLDPILIKNLKAHISKIAFTDPSVKNQIESVIDGFSSWCISRNNKYYSLGYFFEGRYITLDTWFFSGLSHQYLKNLGSQKVVRLQGTDIIRTWLFYSLLSHFLMCESDQTFENIVTHKMVLDEKNKKISKSKGNGPNLDQIVTLQNMQELRLYFCQKPLDQNFSYNVSEKHQIKLFLNKFKHLKLKIEELYNNLNLDATSENIWRVYLTKIDEEENIKKSKKDIIKELILDFKDFFLKDLKNFKFSIILNRIKKFVYNLSRLLKKNVLDTNLLLDSSHMNTQKQIVVILRHILILINDFIEVFK